MIILTLYVTENQIKKNSSNRINDIALKKIFEQGKSNHR